MTKAGRRKQKARRIDNALRRGDAKTLLGEAIRHLRAGDFSNAADLATRAGHAATDDASKSAAHELVVEAMFRQVLAGSDDKRLSRFTKLIALEPGQPRLLFHRAIAYIRAGKYSKALTDLDAVAAAEPDRPGIAALRAFAAVCLDRPVEVDSLDETDRATITALRGFLRTGMAPMDAPEPWQTLTRFAAGKHVDPVALVRHGERLSPRGKAILDYYTGLALFRNGELNSAELAIAAAIQAGFRERRVTESGLKMVRIDILNRVQAADFDRAAALIPISGPTGDRILDETASAVLFHRGWQAALTSRWSDAETDWRRAAKLCDSCQLRQNLALAAEAQEHWAEAADLWRQVIGLNPASPKHPDALADGQLAALWMRAADCYVLDDEGCYDTDPAMGFLRKALKLAGDDVELRLGAVARLAELGDARSAEVGLRGILDDDPDNVDALELLGVLLLNDRPGDALLLFKRLREIDPDRPSLREELVTAFCTVACSKIDFTIEKAEATVREGLELLPDEPELLFVSGRLRQNEGDEAGAAEWFRRAIHAPSDQHGASAAAFHELLHLKSQGDVAREMFGKLLTDPRSNAGFWLDAATSSLECKLGEVWAGRFLDEAVQRSDGLDGALTRPAAILAAIRILAETRGPEALLSRYEQRAVADVDGAAAVEAARGVRAYLRNDEHAAKRHFKQAHRHAGRKADARVRSEIALLEALCEDDHMEPFFDDAPVPPGLMLEVLTRFPDGLPSDLRKIPKELMRELRKYIE